MHWELIVALIVAVPIILFPAAYVWCVNFGGIYVAVREFVARRAARLKQAKINITEGEADPERT
jgi:hypothetical protein